MATISVPASACTWVNYSSANQNYNGNAVVRIGDGTTTTSYGFTYLLFNISGITAGSRIDASSISLNLFQKYWYGGETASAMPIVRVTQAWNPATLTWNNRPSDSGVPMSIGTRYVGDAAGWHQYWSSGLSQLIQMWLDGGAPNYGICIYHTAISPAANKNATDYISIAGGYPPLLDVYFTPDGVPAGTSDAVSGVTSTGFTMNGTISSDGGDALTNRGFHWRPAGGSWTFVQVSPLNVGSFSYQLTGLTEGTSYEYMTYGENHVGSLQGSAIPVTTTNLISTAGLGGTGILSSITGEEIEYGHGGNGGGKGSSIVVPRSVKGYGDGGDGGSGSANGEAGHAGVVIIKYLTADAISVTPTLTMDVFTPSIAAFNGDIFAPYADPTDYKVLDIASVTTDATTPIFTLSAAHGLSNGQVVYVENSDAVESVNGARVITLVANEPTKFTIAGVNVTGAGTAVGTVTFNSSVGMSKTIDSYPERGWLKSSSTTFRTATILKDFRHVSVAHDVLPAGAEITMSWEIDGVGPEQEQGHNGTPIIVSPTETRFKVNHKGYRWSHEIGITPGTLAGTPEIHGINLYWDFVKSRVHTYSLSIYKGAGDGRWDGDPQEAITFLFNTASERADFEDRLFGEYSGTIEKVSHLQSSQSLAEGPSGNVELVVREVL
jgi:hypothetical protein